MNFNISYTRLDIHYIPMFIPDNNIKFFISDSFSVKIKNIIPIATKDIARDTQLINDASNNDSNCFLLFGG